MQIRYIFCFFLLFLIGFQVNSQICLNDIELDRISQDKVQEFVGWQQEHGVETFDELKPSLQSDSDVKGYFIHENVYQVKKNLDEVWNRYIHVSPCKSWNGRKVSFGFLFSKKENRIVYRDQNVAKL
ncbi:MAG TPA: hypothetical protein VLA03_00555, partial [Draconibacterium sp.]|nr:hypothetical protein [Draconibacterium sp.]